MKTLLVFYSFKGTTKALCQSLAGPNTDLYEVTELKKRSTLGAYVLGVYGAIKKKPSKIQPVRIDISPYDLVVAAFPIWASSMPPAMIALFDKINVNNKKVVLLCVSTSGNDCTQRLKPVVEGAGGKLVNVYNVKPGEKVDIEELNKG